MISKSDVFFCYNANVAKFIKKQGVYSITTAIEPTSKKMFTLFPKSDELQQAIDLYKKSE